MAGGVETAVEGLAREGRKTGLVEAGRASPGTDALDVTGDVGRPVGGRWPEQKTASLLGWLAHVGVARARHHRGDRQQPVGVLDGQGLDDHPAHGHTHHVGPSDAGMVEHRDGIGGHVGDGVGRRRPLPGGHGPHRPAHVRLDVGEVGGQPHVAVVEADDEEAFGYELLAPLDPVVDALRAQAVDQEQGVVRAVPEGLVVDLHFAVVGVWHVASYASRSDRSSTMPHSARNCSGSRATFRESR